MRPHLKSGKSWKATTLRAPVNAEDRLWICGSMDLNWIRSADPSLHLHVQWNSNCIFPTLSGRLCNIFEFFFISVFIIFFFFCFGSVLIFALLAICGVCFGAGKTNNPARKQIFIKRRQGKKSNSVSKTYQWVTRSIRLRTQAFYTEQNSDYTDELVH